MSLLGIAWRSIRQRLLTSGLTALSLALGVALVVATLVIGNVVREAFASGQGLGYNLIVGAKGSPLQLVLNSVYLVSKPVENIAWDFYQEFLPAAERPDGVAGRYAGSVAIAVPICMGDYFQSYRVVGTNAAYFDRLTVGDGRPFAFAAGRNFRDDEFFGGVLGGTVAQKLGLQVGDTFSPTHGADDGLVHDPFTVTGILARTDTPVDRGVYVNMEGFYLQEGHAKPVPQEKSRELPSTAEEAGVEAGGALEISPPKSTASPLGSSEISTATKAFTPADPPTGDTTAGAEAGGALDRGPARADPPTTDPAPLPFAQREVTAILVQTAAPGGMPPELLAMGLKNAINEGPDGQAAEPVREIRTLLDLFVRPLELLLLLITALAPPQPRAGSRAPRGRPPGRGGGTGRLGARPWDRGRDRAPDHHQCRGLGRVLLDRPAGRALARALPRGPGHPGRPPAGPGGLQDRRRQVAVGPAPAKPVQ